MRAYPHPTGYKPVPRWKHSFALLPHLIYIFFVFALGACVGSFLNVVVWRLPRGESLVSPPSHCPKCDRPLKWYDNLPIVGWIKLRGRCRFCREPISPRYPIVEAATALIFAGYYVAFYVLQTRTCCPSPVVSRSIDAMGVVTLTPLSQWNLADSWPIFAGYLLLLACLLSASLIDAELYIIPVQIPWLAAGVGVFVHAIADHPAIPGSLNLVGERAVALAAVSAGGTVGLLVSMGLWAIGIMPTTFPDGEPLLEVDRLAIEAEQNAAKLAGEPYDEEPLPPPMSSRDVRREMRKEMLFLLPPLLGAGAVLTPAILSPAVHGAIAGAIHADWLSGLLGSLLGALIGGFLVWIFRIGATLVFGRVAMGLGDVHLMLGVGAVIGAAGAVAAFFIAPLFGILIALYMLVTRRGREMPLGPYLSLATALVILCYCPISLRMDQSLDGLLVLAGMMFGQPTQ